MRAGARAFGWFCGGRRLCLSFRQRRADATKFDFTARSDPDDTIDPATTSLLRFALAVGRQPCVRRRSGQILAEVRAGRRSTAGTAAEAPPAGRLCRIA